MRMARVLISGCGGPASIGVTRSLRKSGNHYLVGTDCNVLTLPFCQTDARYAVPPADNLFYLSILNRIIIAEGIEFVHAQPDPEVARISANRDKLRAKTLLPRHAVVETCQDKYRSYLRWQAAGLRVPQTVLIGDEADLRAAFETLPVPFWIRTIRGAAGRGSLIVRDFASAKTWIDSWNGWGEFSASKLLQGRLVTWQSLWKDGELVCAQGRERLAWAMGNRTRTGVTGVTGIARTIDRHDLDEIAERAIRVIDERPHGIYGVDLKEDGDGVPCPTEINVGRFFTTIQFFAELGLNFPELYVRAGLGEAPRLERRYNPLPSDVYWLRSMDAEPRLFREGDLATMVKTVGTRPIKFEAKPDATVFYDLS